MSYIDPRPAIADPADALLATPVDPAPHWLAAALDRIVSPEHERLDAAATTTIPTGRTNA